MVQPRLILIVKFPENEKLNQAMQSVVLVFFASSCDGSVAGLVVRGLE